MSAKHNKLSVVWYPDPVLRKVAEPINNIADEIIDIAHQMLLIMHDEPGVGLAAPQVGLSLRMFVANPTGEDNDDHVYINPVLTQPTPLTTSMEEGCLSFPGIYAQIMRPIGITITATDLNGKKITETSTEMPARIWQHETDHLNGILFIDRMNETGKLANRRLLKELKANYRPRR